MEDKKNKGNYENIKRIFEAVPELSVDKKKGGNFKFPIYMTDSLAQTGVDSLELSQRSYNSLKRAGIHTIGELCERMPNRSDVRKIKNCGETSASEIFDKLFAYQYSLIKPERRGNYLLHVIEMNVY